MNPVIIAAIVVAVLVIAAVAIIVTRRQRSERLQQQFGPEYEHEVEQAKGDRGKAESALLKREKRVAKFVDDPERSIALADALVAEVMKTRGYPVEDFEQRASDLSVEHPKLVENYRTAHEIALRHAKGEAGTEDLRNALIGYRSLFEELLRAEEPELAH